MHKNPCFTLFLAASLALTVLGCGDAEWDSRAKGKKVLRLGNGAEPQSLDPHTVTGVPEHHILKALFEGLVELDSKNLHPVPGVAESWTVSDDGLVYTFKLRKNAKWSNGDPVTAHDFHYAWRRMLSPNIASLYASMLYGIKNAKPYNEEKITDFGLVGVKAPDDHTFAVTLEAATPYFTLMLNHYSFSPVHKATIEKFGAMDERDTRWILDGNLVGNGPFVLTKWWPDVLIRVEKNPLYWDAESVELDAIEFYPVINGQTEERMFRRGRIHKTDSLLPNKIERYKNENDPRLRIAPYLGTYYYRINTTRPPLDDPKVRLALAMSVDRQAIVEHITKGGQIPTGCFTPPDTAGYTSSASIPYDVEKARALLAEAGYPGGEGFRPIEILYNTQETHRTIAEAIQDMWKQELGIEVTLLNQDWKVYLERVDGLEYDVARAGWIGDYLDPKTFLELLTSDSGNNQTGYASEEYDALLSQSDHTPDPAERFAILDRAEALIVRDAPIIPIYTYTRVYVISPKVKGYTHNLLDNVAYKDIDLVEEESAP